jgi:hypothetical protein
MNELLAQLTPQERRIVVAIGMVVIIVLNLLFVWPHFGEWKRIRKELEVMRGNIESYNKEIALDTDPANGLQKQLRNLVRQEGNGVMDKQVQLSSTIMTQARRTGVNVANLSPGGERPDTNGFFEEESIKISTDSQEPELVSFLYNIGGDPAMIRVSELDLGPMDQNRYRLRGTITLIANYANRAVAPGSKTPPAKGPPGLGTRPASTPATAGKPPASSKPGQTLPKPGPQGQRGPPGFTPNAVPRTPLAPKKKSAGVNNL